MPFQFEPQDLEGVVLVRPRLLRDSRGHFLEAYKRSAFADVGITGPFVQENLSQSTRGVLRGLHYQLPPHAQGKLVQVLAGAVFDVCVDLRRDSPDFGRWLGRKLDAEAHELLYLPPGFGHGFVVLSETADVSYRCTAEYAPASERGVRWDDADLAISWPVSDPIVSAKDAALPPLRQADVFEAPLS
ncbi:MAG: dTDP-4-dehydrorhamnose 3,5-epimerase [Planctomycetes bacterium]|nr:dTDP-4-dehydrorhamnose 3,5-epimerase [Planctomycetota bacterium]